MVDANGQPLFAQLHKAMNGLRVGPLSWYLEFTTTLRGEFGFKETADPTVHFRTEKAKSITLVLVYVDDLLVYIENPATAVSLYRSLAKKYKMKLTGSLKPEETGQLEFLGRVITRTTSGGPVFFGLKPGYLRSLGEEFGITKSKSRTGLGNLERRFKSKPSVPISQEAYERYRRVLGKLMWASLTLPHLAYVVGFLGRHQADPWSQAEDCLRKTVRWILGLPEMWQRFSVDNPYYPGYTSEQLISGYVDASWNIASVSGCILCWRGMMVKAFSRKQTITALSSAEAELSALTEAAKEGIYISLLLETFLQGHPSGEVGSYPIYLESDSEAALSISRVTGLLRRVRHLELRHRYLQELVRNERLILSHLSGEMNPADGLTKSPEHASMFNNMVNAYGLERIPDSDLDLLFIPENLHSEASFLAETAETANALAPRLAVFESVARDLARRAVKFLVVELYCKEGSALESVCQKEDVPYVGISRKIDLFNEETQEFLSEVFSVLKPENPSVRLYVHIASPCTAGCSFRFKNWRKPGYKKKWRKQLDDHVKGWRMMCKLLVPYVRKPECLLTQEWPKKSALWHEGTYRNARRKLGLVFGRDVDRCTFDGVYKRWYFATNQESWCRQFSGRSCPGKDHVHAEAESLEATGYYPVKLGRALLKCARKVLLEGFAGVCALVLVGRCLSAGPSPSAF